MKLKTPTLPRKQHRAFPTAPAGTAVPFGAPPVQPAPPMQAAPPMQPAPVPTAPVAAPTPPVHRAQPGPAPVSPLRKIAAVPATPARQRNAAVMIAGLAFIIIAGALAASVASSFDDSIDVLVAAGPIAEGQRVNEQHFRVVQIAAAAGDIAAVSPDAREELIGRIAAGPIGAGSMIHPDQFATPLTETLVVVGAALQPDQYPANGAKPGDRVRLIEVGARFDSDDGSFSNSNELAIGEITAVVALSQKELHFSIRVSESVANLIAERVNEDRLVIALLDQSTTLERLDPLEPAQPVVPLQLTPFDADNAGTGDSSAAE